METKYSEELVKKCADLYTSNVYYRDIAKQLKIPEGSVHSIARRYLGERYKPVKRKSSKKRNFYTFDQKKTLVDLVNGGMTYRQASKKTGIKLCSVPSIVKYMRVDLKQTKIEKQDQSTGKMDLIEAILKSSMTEQEKLTCMKGLLSITA